MSLRVFFLIGAFLTGVAVILTDLIIGEITQQELLMKISAVIVFSCFAFYIPTLFRIIKKSGENSKKRKDSSSISVLASLQDHGLGGF